MAAIFLYKNDASIALRRLGRSKSRSQVAIVPGDAGRYGRANAD
jgi:hypothetical protein